MPPRHSLVDTRTRLALLALYEVPDPDHPGGIIPGYDQEHAERTTRIVRMLAQALRLDPRWYEDLEVTCLLHDLGRAGMDPQLFGAVFTLAERRGIPVRIRQFLEKYPDVPEVEAAERFIALLTPDLERAGIPIDPRLREHVEMRLDFRGRLRRVLAQSKPRLAAVGVHVAPWMETVMLYYYYPHLMEGQPPDVRLMGEILVACENFEAYNNARRGRDYYGRSAEQLRSVFEALAEFVRQGLVSERVMKALRSLTAAGQLDDVIKEARGLPASAELPAADQAYQRELAVK